MNENIKKARENAGFSQKQVALELKVSGATVCEWEKGKKNRPEVSLRPAAMRFKKVFQSEKIFTGIFFCL